MIHFYIEGDVKPIHSQVKIEYLPRIGDVLSLQGYEESYFVVDQVIHRINTGDSKFEIEVILKTWEDYEVSDPSLDEIDEYEPPVDDEGNCGYCHDPECPGGRDCNWYDEGVIDPWNPI